MTVVSADRWSLHRGFSSITEGANEPVAVEQWPMEQATVVTVDRWSLHGGFSSITEGGQ